MFLFVFEFSEFVFLCARYIFVGNINAHCQNYFWVVLIYVTCGKRNVHKLKINSNSYKKREHVVCFSFILDTLSEIKLKFLLLLPWLLKYIFLKIDSAMEIASF